MLVLFYAFYFLAIDLVMIETGVLVEGVGFRELILPDAATVAIDSSLFTRYTLYTLP